MAILEKSMRLSAHALIFAEADYEGRVRGNHKSRNLYCSKETAKVAINVADYSAVTLIVIVAITSVCKLISSG